MSPAVGTLRPCGAAAAALLLLVLNAACRTAAQSSYVPSPLDVAIICPL
jgi:hypothetical protein